MKLILRYVAFIVLLFIFSCTKDVGKVNQGNYPNNIDVIISSNCAVSGCHNAKSYLAAGGYNLENWTSMFYGATNGSPVIPYNSKFSSMCYFINTYPALGSQNQPTMPLNGKALSYSQVKQIEDWINAGAPDINGKVMWADNPLRKKLYAVNQGCDVVTVFDSETMLPMRFIHVGHKAEANTPHMVRVSPDGQYWYVLFVNTNIMQKFRCSDDAYVGDIPLTPVAAGTSGDPNDDATQWNTFVISKNGRLAYCVSWPEGKLAKVDLNNMKLLYYQGGLGAAHGIVLNGNETKVYVASQTGNFITEFDTAFTTSRDIMLDNSIIKNTSKSLDPHDMILSPDNNNIIITCQQSNDVRVYNIPSDHVTAFLPVGAYPQEIVYSQGTNEYFVTCMEDTTIFPGSHGLVARIDAGSLMVSRVKCGFQPHGLAVDETTKTLYVLSRNIISNGPPPHHTSECTGRNGFVNFINLNTFTVSDKRYELSVDPYFIFARP